MDLLFEDIDGESGERSSVQLLKIIAGDTSSSRYKASDGQIRERSSIIDLANYKFNRA
jgi:hypothetical protein